MTDRRMWAAVLTLLVAATVSCAPNGSGWVSPIAFDTASVVVVSGTDSANLLIEVAETDEERAFGMSRRPVLDHDSGMLFLFDSLQAPDHGFWMWQTNVPLDIAFLDPDGIIVAILSMPVCGNRVESCPSHAPGEPYASALEANLGWFSAQGVEVGDRVEVAR